MNIRYRWICLTVVQFVTLATLALTVLFLFTS